MDLNTKIMSSEGLVHTELEDEVVVMHVVDGKYYALNAVGSAVWRKISSPICISDVCDAIEQEFEVERDICRRDVLALVEELYGVDLVEIVE